MNARTAPRFQPALRPSRFLRSAASGLFILFLLAAAAFTPAPPAQAASPQSSAASLAFSDPFGFAPHTKYSPRITHDTSGKLIEDTSYGVRNPDMGGSTCFGVDWSIIYHAGEDLYASQADSSISTQNAWVKAVADGVVKYAPSAINYPGLVVIIEHTLGSGEKVYSVYAHLKGPLQVKAGQQVTRGTLLGQVMYLPYSGNYPQYHPSGDDSHLHFELRQFYSATSIYPAPYTYCNNAANVPGVGYTYPTSPSQFPSASQHYLDPVSFVSSNPLKFFIPFAGK